MPNSNTCNDCGHIERNHQSIPLTDITRGLNKGYCYTCAYGRMSNYCEGFK